MDLVLDIDNHRIKGALFEEDQLVSLFRVAPEKEALKPELEGKQISDLLISSVNAEGSALAKEVLDDLSLPYKLLDFTSVKIKLNVDEPEQVGHDRIANVYGALHRFPQNDCIVVDLGTAVTFDYASCDGSYQGGAIYPCLALGAKALGMYTDLLPEIAPAISKEAVAKTTETHIQSGLYWGLLGAIERISFEMRNFSQNPSNVKVIATGGLIQSLGEPFIEQLKDLTDLIDPAITLIGIHEILKEF